MKNVPLWMNLKGNYVDKLRKKLYNKQKREVLFMGRCLLCGKEVSDSVELCETCKNKMESEDNNAVKDLFVSDNFEIRHERSEIYNAISPSDGKWRHILSVICGVLAVCFMIVFMLIAFSEGANAVFCGALASAGGTCFILCFAFFFFTQVIKRKNMQL